VRPGKSGSLALFVSLFTLSPSRLLSAGVSLTGPTGEEQARPRSLTALTSEEQSRPRSLTAPIGEEQEVSLSQLPHAFLLLLFFHLFIF